LDTKSKNIANFVKNTFMSTIELKEKLHRYIDNADETFLKMVHAMSKVYVKPLIVGFDVNDAPITQQDLK
jgi:hypothetical protein